MTDDEQPHEPPTGREITAALYGGTAFLFAGIGLGAHTLGVNAEAVLNTSEPLLSFCLMTILIGYITLLTGHKMAVAAAREDSEPWLDDGAGNSEVADGE